MALSFAHGSIAWNAADAATTTYTVSGLSFQPKAIVFVINGEESATDNVSTGRDLYVCYGFATGTADRRCVGFFSDFNTAAADTQEAYRTDAVLVTISAAAAVDGLLDLTAINSDGFVLTVDDAAPVNLRVFWYAWGGADITNQQTGEIVEPAATGNQSYTVGAGWTPDVVLFAGCQLTGAAPAVGAADSGLMFGAASGTGAGNQWVSATNSDENSATMDTDHYGIGSECVAMMTQAGGNPNARGQFNGFDAQGFDINWVARGVTNRRYIYLAMQGGDWKAGNYSIQVQTVGNTTTVSGLAFQPTGALIVDHANVESTAGTSQVGSAATIGCFSSTTSRRAMGFLEENGTSNSELDSAIDYDAIDVLPNGSTGLAWAVDIDAVLSDGFRVIVDTALGSALNCFTGYLAFADTPLVTFTYPQLERMTRGLERGMNYGIY